jgi:hypothetical protein
MKKPGRTVPPSRVSAGPARTTRLPDDVALLSGPTEDGEGARLLRFRRGALYAGEVRPVREGQPLGQHELVRLRPLHDRVPLCEVEVLHAPEAQAERNGPTRVASKSYRRNWHVVFGSSADKGATAKKKLRELN